MSLCFISSSAIVFTVYTIQDNVFILQEPCRFLACVSMLLRDRLQALWRIKESDKMVHDALCRTVAKIVAESATVLSVQVAVTIEISR